MGHIELFSEENCGGRSKKFSTDMRSLSKDEFSHVAKSLLVTGDPWVVFAKTDYAGNFEMFAEGRHSILPHYVAGKIESMRLVLGGQVNPEIEIFQYPNFQGEPVPLVGPTASLTPYGFETACSHRVSRGAWLFYPLKKYEGQRMVTFPGNEMAKYPTWQVASLKPCRPAAKS